MAKKRVHEIAKERGISSKEVISVLQAAGLNVKAAASSVDENDILMAFSNGSDAVAPSGNGAAAEAPAAAGDAQAPAATPDPAAARPTRPADRGPGGRRRRVVIDSQAARRGTGPPPPQQPPRRSRGRRRRTPWVEPDLNAPPPPVEEAPATRILSRAEAAALGFGPAGEQETPWALAHVPIARYGEVLGAVVVASHRPRTFTERELSFIERLARRDARDFDRRRGRAA